MNYIPLLGTIVFIHLLGAISPGPDFVMAVRNSIIHSRRAGIFTAIGFGLGIAVHIIYSAAGLALLISKSILLFNAIKLLGAGYLIYIGIKSFCARSLPIVITAERAARDITPLMAIKMGFLTNALNPKATLFFLSLFTFVITPDVPKVVLLIASVLMVINQILWFSFVAIFFTQRHVQSLLNRFQGVFNKLFGTILVALGIKVALATRE